MGFPPVRLFCPASRDCVAFPKLVLETGIDDLLDAQCLTELLGIHKLYMNIFCELIEPVVGPTESNTSVELERLNVFKPPTSEDRAAWYLSFAMPIWSLAVAEGARVLEDEYRFCKEILGEEQSAKGAVSTEAPRVSQKPRPRKASSRHRTPMRSSPVSKKGTGTAAGSRYPPWINDLLFAALLRNPHPASTDLDVLRQKTKLTSDSLSNWFRNMRKRHLKPMQEGRNSPKTFLDFVLLYEYGTTLVEEKKCGTPRATTGDGSSWSSVDSDDAVDGEKAHVASRLMHPQRASTRRKSSPAPFPGFVSGAAAEHALQKVEIKANEEDAEAMEC